MKLTWGGMAVAVGGFFLVNVLGITDSCSSEVSAKVVQYMPIIGGSLMSLIGGHKLAGRKWYGGHM